MLVPNTCANVVSFLLPVCLEMFSGCGESFLYFWVLCLHPHTVGAVSITLWFEWSSSCFPKLSACLIPKPSPATVPRRDSIKEGQRRAAVTGSCRSATTDVTHGGHCTETALQRRQPVAAFRLVLQFGDLK